jgi:hypothetical protein
MQLPWQFQDWPRQRLTSRLPSRRLAGDDGITDAAIECHTPIILLHMAITLRLHTTRLYIQHTLTMRPIGITDPTTLPITDKREGVYAWLAILFQSKGAHTSDNSAARSSTDGSSFSGLFTRLEMGHIVIGSDGKVIARVRFETEPAVVARGLKDRGQ